MTSVQELDLERFEELFKTRAQGPIVDLSCTKSKVAQKTVNKVTLLDANRSKNLAITLRKANKTTEEICKAIEKYSTLVFQSSFKPGVPREPLCSLFSVFPSCNTPVSNDNHLLMIKLGVLEEGNI